jgi:hypothetical protein
MNLSAHINEQASVVDRNPTDGYLVVLLYRKGHDKGPQPHEVLMTTHRMTKTPEYQTWSSMKGRCYNPNNKSFKDYGGLGVAVCDEWVNDFSAFVRDMGMRPSYEHSIDRKDGSKNYTKDNCRWATKEEQSQNRPEFVIPLTYKGRTQTLAEWAREIGIFPQTLYNRHNAGWAVERMLGQKPSNKIRSDNKVLVFNGKSQTLAEWTKEIGICRNGLKERLRRGWSVEMALTAPIDRRRVRKSS